MGKVVVSESKSISEYLRQMDEIGEATAEYEGVFGYSLGETEPRIPGYEYPPYDFEPTTQITNLEPEEAAAE